MINHKDENCAYCMEGALVDKFGIKIRELAASKVYLFREQSHLGRVIVASKFHVSELVDLPTRERRAFLDDVAIVSAALHRLFKPAKVNYGAYGDTGCHLHFHLVPKYADDVFEWGGTFAMNPDRKYLSEDEYADLVARISAELVRSEDADLRKSLARLRAEITADGKVDFAESSMLLQLLEPLAGSGVSIDNLISELKDVRKDRVVEADESARLISLLDALLA